MIEMECVVVSGYGSAQLQRGSDAGHSIWEGLISTPALHVPITIPPFKQWH